MPTLLALPLLMLLGLPVAAAQEPIAPLADLAEAAHEYAGQIRAGNGKPYPESGRATLSAAADLLYAREQCDQAVALRKQALTGVEHVGYQGWFHLGSAARCAGHWNDAVNASYLAFEQSTEAPMKAKAAALLGLSLQAHWRYGDRKALAAYRLADRESTIEAMPWLAERIAELERSLAESEQLRIDRYFVQDDVAIPAVCIDFSADMPAADAQAYGDYIRFTPAFDARFRLDDSDEVCAEGADFGVRYRVSLLAGLKDAAGLSLDQALTGDVTVGNRTPSLWFENSRYVLPRDGGGVPVHGINVEQVKLALYRIGERNLTQTFVRDSFGSDIRNSEAASIRDRLGERVWQGRAELNARPNQELVSNLQVSPFVTPAPGVYLLTARIQSTDQADAEENEGRGEDEDEDEEGWRRVATQWLVMTDIGLSTYQGEDGLTVIARSLQSAEPLAGMRIRLYARNNRALGEVITDASGKGHFPAELMTRAGGVSPDLLMAYGPDGDFNFFSLQTSAFDLSDRGVGGRALPGPLDAFVTTERGVYRPGEQVQVTVLLRDDRGDSVDGLPLTLRIERPDGKVAVERLLIPAGAGGYSTGIELLSAARTGHWKALAYVDTGAPPVGEQRFLVEAIVPPRLEVHVSAQPEAPLRPDTKAVIGIEARYLFGAPAGGLQVNGSVRVAPDSDPFPAFPGYRFGSVDEEDDSVLIPLDPVTTDDRGLANLAFRIDRLPRVRRPLKVKVRVEVSDVDSRVVATTYAMALHHQPLFLGIKPPGDAGVISEEDEAVFEVIALDSDGLPLARPGLHYRLIEEQVDFQWYREEGQWQFKRQIRDRLLDEGNLSVSTAEPASISRSLATGHYRLEVRDRAGSVFSSARLQVGWQTAEGQAETPDRLRVATDKAAYAPGETARLHLEVPFAGRAELVIATDRVISVRELALPERTAVLDVEIDPAWGAGAYALLTAYRPDGGIAGRGPRRAIGVAWIGIDPGHRQLHIALDAPALTRPRQTLPVEVKVSGQASGSAVFVTLAAVDDGVLQLTGYPSPDPLTHYFGQRRLGVAIRDLYGRLIDGRKGVASSVRSGGGAPAGRQGAPASHIKILSRFSGVVATDTEGRALIPFELPDFNGRLRLMAVAWSASRLGSAATDVTVRDPVVVMPALPRFLAKGDRSQASLLIQNLDGPEGEYRLTWRASGALSTTDENAEARFSLHTGERKVLTLSLEAVSVGEGRLSVDLHGPGDLALNHSLSLAVRAPFLPQTRRRLGKIESSQEMTLGPQLTEGLQSEGLAGIVSISATPDLDVPGLMKQLDLYPYGCLEQVISRAFPLLYLERLNERWGYRSKIPVAERLSDAVARTLDKQLDSGGFTLWGSRDEAEPWPSVYALDFLQRARDADVAVPDFAWRRGLGWLRRQIEYTQIGNPDRLAVQAYALYVLARAGEVDARTARYLLNEVGEKLPSGLAAAQIGAVLALAGDRLHAAEAFVLADRMERTTGTRDYGTPLRDLAARLLLEFEVTGGGDQFALQIQMLADRMAASPWLSTQEQAWLVRVANAVTGEGDDLQLQVDGIAIKELEKSPILHFDAASLTSGVKLHNTGAETAWYSLTVTGSPAEEPAPLESGLSIQRTLYNLAGKPVTTGTVEQGEMLLVVIEGEAENDTSSQPLDHPLLIVDPLPAGLEIENSRIGNGHELTDMASLTELSEMRYTEALDDRFVAALDLVDGERRFRVAYLVRAVTPGRYRMPPAEVEDMYKPHYRARGEAGWLNIIARE